MTDRKKVKVDTMLQELKENVVRTVRALKKLRKNPLIRGPEFKEIVGKWPGDGAKVGDLSQEAVVECRGLDEMTKRHLHSDRHRPKDMAELRNLPGMQTHIARDCMKQPRCMLCEARDGNAHFMSKTTNN